MFRSTTYATLLLLLLTQITQAATLTADSSNIVTGATGVTVNGNLYDVAIGDGTCVSLFNGCDQTADFPFSSSSDTIGALQALLTLVMQSPYRNSPASFSGCTLPQGCSILTPYNFDQGFAISVTLNITETSLPTVPTDLQVGVNPPGTLDGISSLTYARWTPHKVNKVPEPNALMLLGIGLLSQRWLRTRGKRVPV